MPLIQDGNGFWTDTPATAGGGAALNDNFDKISSLMDLSTPGVVRLIAQSSFEFTNPSGDAGTPLFKAVRNAGFSNFLEFYADDGTTLLFRMASDGSLYSIQSTPDVLWVNFARKYTHADLTLLSGIFTWNLSNNDWATITLTEDSELAMTGLKPGHYTLRIIMGGSGGYALTYPAGIVWPGDVVPVPSPDVGDVDIVEFFSPDGVTFYPV